MTGEWTDFSRDGVKRMRFENAGNLASCGYYFQLTRGRVLSREKHCHRFYELICVMDGRCAHEVNGLLFDCPPGTLFFLRPEDTHRFVSQSAGTSVAALSVTVEEMRKFLIAYGLVEIAAYQPDAMSEAVPTVTLSAGERVRLSGLCAEAAAGLTISPDGRKTPESRRAGQDGPVRERVILGELLSCFLTKEDRAAEDLPPMLARWLSEMNRPENAAEGVQAFLRVSNFSHSQLCRLTKRWLGMTPGGVVNGIRLRLAWERIAWGTEDYETICEEVGFSSFSHFCKLIKARYRKTPAQIRREAAGTARTV